jgi:hypothetical protein
VTVLNHDLALLHILHRPPSDSPACNTSALSKLCTSALGRGLRCHSVIYCCLADECKGREEERGETETCPEIWGGLPREPANGSFPFNQCSSGSVIQLRGQTLPTCTIFLNGQPLFCGGSARQLRAQWSVPWVVPVPNHGPVGRTTPRMRLGGYGTRLSGSGDGSGDKRWPIVASNPSQALSSVPESSAALRHTGCGWRAAEAEDKLQAVGWAANVQPQNHHDGEHHTNNRPFCCTVL